MSAANSKDHDAQTTTAEQVATPPAIIPEPEIKTLEQFIQERRFHQVATANTDFLINAIEDPELRHILRADHLHLESVDRGRGAADEGFLFVAIEGDACLGERAVDVALLVAVGDGEAQNLTPFPSPLRSRRAIGLCTDGCRQVESAVL